MDYLAVPFWEYTAGNWTTSLCVDTTLPFNNNTEMVKMTEITMMTGMGKHAN